MQEPGSPLVPLDPTRLQQQMQQPMRESVKRTMSASSVGSMDSSGGPHYANNPAPGGGSSNNGGGAGNASTEVQQTPMTPQFQQQLSPQFSPMPSAQQRFWAAQASPHSSFAQQQQQQNLYGQMIRVPGQNTDMLSLSSPSSVQSSIGSPIQTQPQTPGALQQQQQVHPSAFHQQQSQHVYQHQGQIQQMNFSHNQQQQPPMAYHQQQQQMHFQQQASAQIAQQQHYGHPDPHQMHATGTSFSPNQQPQTPRHVMQANAPQSSQPGRLVSPQQQQAVHVVHNGQRLVVAQPPHPRYVQGPSPNMQTAYHSQVHGQMMYQAQQQHQQRLLSPMGTPPNSGAQSVSASSLSPYAGQQQQQMTAQNFPASFSIQQQAQQFSAGQQPNQQQQNVVMQQGAPQIVRNQQILQSPVQNQGQTLLQQQMQLQQGSSQMQRAPLAAHHQPQNLLTSPNSGPQNLQQHQQQQIFQQQRQSYQIQQQHFQFQGAQQFPGQGVAGPSVSIKAQQHQQSCQPLQHAQNVMNVAQSQQHGSILVTPRALTTSQQSVSYVGNQTQQGLSPGSTPAGSRVQILGPGTASGFHQILPSPQQQHVIVANSGAIRGPPVFFSSAGPGPPGGAYLHPQQQHHVTLVPGPANQTQGQMPAESMRPQYFGHDVTLNVPPEMCLLGCVFLIIDYDRILDQKEVSDWRIVIVQHGGEVETSYTNKCSHVICDSLRHPVVQQALKESKRCVTAQWLNDCVLLKRMQPPWKVVHFPSPYGDNKPCRNRIFSVCGFDIMERTCLKQMIMAVGARYTSYLSRHNTLLVAKCLEGEKVAKAVEWKIPIVNVQWLTELFLGQQTVLQSLNNPKYHQFLTKEAAQHANIELFRIDPSASPFVVLMNAWRNPVTVSVDCWKLAGERKQKVEEDCKLFPFKKLRLSPAPEDVEIEKRRKEQQQNNVNLDFSAPRICFTGLYNAEVENLTKKALWLGATVEQEVKDCTHLVAADLKRTRKLLEGLVLGRFIVSALWIRQSYKQQQFLDCIDYIVKDEGNEKFFGFNVKLSIYRARLKRLFEDMIFYLTPSVQPSPSTLVDLIQSAGGSVVQQRPSSARILDLQQAGVQFVIITCDNDFHLCQHLLELGIFVHSAEFVLTGILRQEVDFQSYRIEPKPTDPSSSKSGRET